MFLLVNNTFINKDKIVSIKLHDNETRLSVLTEKSGKSDHLISLKCKVTLNDIATALQAWSDTNKAMMVLDLAEVLEGYYASTKG